jgi:hypothetical protein
MMRRPGRMGGSRPYSIEILIAELDICIPGLNVQRNCHVDAY